MSIHTMTTQASPVDLLIEILIAEDSSTQAERLRYLLEQHRYRVMVVEDGRAALKWLANQHPAAVITDINMPHLNGYDLCRQIKADKRLRDIPVILLTSMSDAMDVLEGLACGADSFITKPYSEDYLVARVERTLADAALPHSGRASIKVEIPLPGQSGVITADPQRMVSLLISTYEAAIYRNTELVHTQDALRSLNENLEDLVEERTAVLSAEIAERQQAEGRIRYLAGVLENVSDAIVSLDLQGRIQSWNAGAENLFGYQSEAVLGQPYAEVVTYNYLDTTEAEVFRQMGETGRWRGEVGTQRKDGSLIYVLVAAAALKDIGGTVTGFSAVLHDTTDRKQAQMALAQSNDLLSRAEEIGQTGSWRWDMLADQVTWSASLYRMFGQAPESLGATYAAYLERVHPDDRERVRAVIEGAHLTTAPYEFECRIIRADGVVRTHFTRAEVVRDDRGRPTHQLGIGMDITERKQRERELEAIATVSTALRTADSQAQMLPIVLEQVMGLLGACGAALAMREPGSEELVITLGQGEVAEITGLRLPGGAGISAQVLTTGQPYVSDDLSADTLRYQIDQLDTHRASACIPLVTSSNVLGVLWASRAVAFSAVEVRVLSAIASIAASAIQRAGLHEQTGQRLQRLTALREIDSAIMNSLDLRTTLTIILGQVTGQLGVDACDILLLSAGMSELEFAAGRGFRTTGIERTRLRLGRGHAGRAALERRLVAVPDIAADLHPLSRLLLLAGEAFGSQFCVPLVVKGQVVGVLEVWNRAPFNPDADWLGYLETLAGLSAIAVSDAWLFADLQRSNLDMRLAYDTTLEGWSAALDLRDKETEGHSQRVTQMTLKLARALDVSEDEREHIRRGALLHDIGKMAVPDAILNKPGPLTDDEWVVMRRHPGTAYELLSPTAFLRLALDIPYCHHEKWDGTGYPRQLKGDAIPLSARIFAAVDVWDALRSNRPYRAGWPEEQVRDYLRDQAGKHFDPQVVTTFLTLIELPQETIP